MYNSFTFIFFSLFFYFVCPTSSSSVVASDQLIFWSNNVRNNIPLNLLPKLSPLKVAEIENFASLVSNESIASNLTFCRLANLACATNLHHFRVLTEIYKYSKGKLSTPFVKVDNRSFFRVSMLKKGNKMYVPNVQDNYPSRAFLPNEIAQMISMNLTELQKLFPPSFKYHNTKEAIQTTISYCSSPALKDEIKSCPTSLEGMINFAKVSLRHKHLLAFSSGGINGFGHELIITNIERFGATKILSCHDVFLPFSTYFCHMLSSTRLYSVDVIDPTTMVGVTTALIVCHMDTSTWPRDHVAFKILKSYPGNGEACHWITQTDLVFIGQGEDITTNN